MIALETRAYALPPLWRLVTKFGYFISLAAALGASLTHAWALRPALASADDRTATATRRRATTVLGASGLLLLAFGYAQLAGRVARSQPAIPFGQAVRPANIARYIARPATPGEWVSQGVLSAGQNLAYLAAVILLVTAWVRRDDRPSLPAGLTVTLGTLIGSIPRRARDGDQVASTLFTQAHILGGSLWLGGLALLAACAVGRCDPGPMESAAWARAWSRFSTIALWSVGAVVTSGLWLTRRQLGAVDQFWTTTFGRVLLAKLLLVVALLGAGAWNQLVLMPSIAREQRRHRDERVGRLVLTRFPRVVASETALGVLVVGCVALLAGSGRAEAGQPEAGPIAVSTAALGLGLIALMATSFWATTRASAALARLEAPDDQVAPARPPRPGSSALLP